MSMSYTYDKAIAEAAYQSYLEAIAEAEATYKAAYKASSYDPLRSYLEAIAEAKRIYLDLACEDAKAKDKAKDKVLT